jgi:hypothetical protein
MRNIATASSELDLVQWEERQCEQRMSTLSEAGDND